MTFPRAWPNFISAWRGADAATLARGEGRGEGWHQGAVWASALFSVVVLATAELNEMVQAGIPAPSSAGLMAVGKGASVINYYSEKEVQSLRNFGKGIRP
jgi:hypothetical protein